MNITIWVSLFEYHYLSINIWVSLFEFHYLSITIWVSLFRYHYLSPNIWVSLFEYHYLCITIWLSPFEYPYLSITIWVSLFEHHYMSCTQENRESKKLSNKLTLFFTSSENLEVKASRSKELKERGCTKLKTWCQSNYSRLLSDSPWRKTKLGIASRRLTVCKDAFRQGNPEVLMTNHHLSRNFSRNCPNNPLNYFWTL